MASPANGSVLGKYIVRERIGFGGMGEVFLAEHKVMRRRVALKVLPPAKADDAAARERFYREARAAGALAHPNLVRAYDVDCDRGTHFLVLEYVDGSSLHDVVTRHGPLDPTRAGHYLWQAALGLQHAHEAGLIHRDVKPANILVDRQGVVKILDLGLARFFAERDDGLTVDDPGGPAVLGTADYLAPEQARNSREVDIRADVYGLGATAYFLLTGRPMFDVATVAQKLVCHQMTEPTPLRELRADVPEDLAAAVARMVAKDPAERFPTPAAVAAALARFGDAAVPPPPAHEMPPAGPLATGPSSAVASASGILRATARAATGPASSSRNLSAAGLSGRGLKVAASDTTENRAGETGVPKGIPAVEPPPRRVGWHTLVAGCLALLTGVGAALGWHFLRPAPSGAVNATGPLNVATGQTYPTLQAALDAARPGDRIVLRAAVAEAVKLEGGRGRGVIVEGDGGEQITWTAPPNAGPRQPLLTAAGADGLVVRNVHFDGGGSVETLVLATGQCPGLTFDGVEFRGYRSTGLRLANCAGAPGRPVRLSRLRAVGGGGADAVAFVAEDGQATRDVKLLDSRLEGTGVRFRGAAADVEVAGNRVWKANAGVRFDRGGAEPLDVTVRQNTIAEARTAIRFAEMPPAEAAVALRKNLFARCKELVTFDDIKTAPAHSAAAWVWFGDDFDEKGYPADTRYFRGAFDLPAAPPAATLDVMADDGARVWVNGQLAAKATFQFITRRVEAFDATRFLKPGRNVIAVAATNGAGANPGGTNAAGLLVRLTAGGPDPRELLTTNETWLGARSVTSGWESPAFDDAAWAPVRVLSSYESYPAGFHWDSVVRPQVGARVTKLFRGSAGNVSDRNGSLAFDAPAVAHLAGHLTLPVDADDATFLRYPADDAVLVTKHKSPGAGPVRKK